MESRDVETVRNAIRDAYGFQVSEQYAQDFIAFVEKAMKGDYVGN